MKPTKMYLPSTHDWYTKQASLESNTFKGMSHIATEYAISALSMAYKLKIKPCYCNIYVSCVINTFNSKYIRICLYQHLCKHTHVLTSYL